MPETHFILHWPDDSEQTCYSPSTVVTEYLEAKQSYRIDDFLERARTALNKASERVERKYGHPCSRALGQLAEIERVAVKFQGQSDVVMCKEILG